MSFLTRVFSKSRKNTLIQKPESPTLTHITQTCTVSDVSGRNRRTLKKRGSQVPTEVQSIMHPDDSDSELEIISRVQSHHSLKVINRDERPLPPVLYQDGHTSHPRSESDSSSSLGRSIPESQRYQSSKPTITEVVYGPGSPYPSGQLSPDSNSPGPTPIIPGPHFNRRNVARGLSQKTYRSPSPSRYHSGGSSRHSRRSRDNSSSNRSSQSDRESSGMRTREIVVPTRRRSRENSVERDSYRRSPSPSRGMPESRNPSFHTHQNNRSHRNYRRERRGSSLRISLPNGEQFEAYADPRHGRGKFTYYVIPDGVKITLKDSSGREITTVGESGSHHVTPMKVEDEDGHVLYEVRGRRRRRGNSVTHREPSPRWRGPHIVVVDGDGRLLPVYKRRIV